MKNKIIIILLILLSFNCIGKNVVDKSVIEKLLGNQIKDLRLVGFRYGNFTNSGNIEILAYFNDASIAKSSTALYNVAGWLYVFVIKDNKVLKRYRCAEGNIGVYSEDKDRALITNNDIIHNSKLKFGKWDGYTFVYDYNENGRDEILLLQNGPETFLPYIYEFHDGKMKTVLNVKDEDDFDANVKGLINTTSDKNGKYIEIYKAPFSAITNPVLWEKYQWNKIKKIYELIEKGRKPSVEK